MSSNNDQGPNNQSGSIFFEQKKYEPKPIPTHQEPSFPNAGKADEYEDDPEFGNKLAGVLVPIIAVLLLLLLGGGIFFMTGGKINNKNAKPDKSSSRDNDDDDDDDDDDDSGNRRDTAHGNGPAQSGILMPGESDLDQALSDAGAGSGEITLSLIWYNSDDVDLHVMTPSGTELYYGNRSVGSGTLDIDANADMMMDEPVENIYFTDPSEGTYTVWIEDYSDRNDGYTGYLVRVTVNGDSRLFEGHIDGSGTDIDIIEFEYERR